MALSKAEIRLKQVSKTAAKCGLCTNHKTMLVFSIVHCSMQLDCRHKHTSRMKNVPGSGNLHVVLSPCLILVEE